MAEVVKKKGMEEITVEELVSEITPTGRGMSCLEPTPTPNPLSF